MPDNRLTLKDGEGQVQHGDYPQDVGSANATDTRQIDPQESAVPVIEVDWQGILDRARGAKAATATAPVTTGARRPVVLPQPRAPLIVPGAGSPEVDGGRGFPRLGPALDEAPSEKPPQKALTQQDRIEALLQQILAAIIEPPAGQRDGPAVIIRTVTVVAAGTPVEGPDIPVPPGWKCTVRQRYHAADRTGYIAFSEQEVKNSSTRTEFRNQVSVDFGRVRNMAELWFDADTASTIFEVLAEQ